MLKFLINKYFKQKTLKILSKTKITIIIKNTIFKIIQLVENHQPLSKKDEEKLFKKYIKL